MVRFLLMAALLSLAPVMAREPAAPVDPFPLLSGERIGGLRLGADAAAVRATVPGCRWTRGSERLWAADGAHHQSWDSPGCGLRLDMVAERAGGEQRVGSIRLTPPSPLRTSRGIGIGSTEAEVRRAYAREWNPEESRQAGAFVAGSLYGGLVVTLRQGRVASLFLGAAAE